MINASQSEAVRYLCSPLNLLLTTASICEPFPQLASSPLHSHPKYGWESQSRTAAAYILFLCVFKIHFSSVFLSTPPPRPQMSFSVQRQTSINGIHISSDAIYFFLHIIFLKRVLLSDPLSHMHVNKPTKVIWRTGSPLLVRPSSKTRASLQVNTRHSCFSYVLLWNSAGPSLSQISANLEEVSVSFPCSQTERRLCNCGAVRIIPKFSAVHPDRFTHDYISLPTCSLSWNTLKSSRQ